MNTTLFRWLGGVCVAALTALLPAGTHALEPELSRYLFVADPGSSRIVVIDTVDDSPDSTLELSAPPSDLVVSADAGMLVASHAAGNMLSVVDLDRIGTARTVSVDHAVDAMRLHPDGHMVAVSGTRSGTVTLVDLRSGRPTVAVSGLPRPSAFTFSRAGDLLFVASEGGEIISVLDVDTGSVVHTLRATSAGEGTSGTRVTGFARTPGGELGFLMHGESGRVTILDLQTRKVAGHLRMDGEVRRAYPTANSQYVLVPDLGSGTVSVVSTWTLGESGRFQVGRDVIDLDMGYFDSVAVAISRASQSAYLYDLTNERMLAEIPLPGRPESSIPSANGLKLYVALAGTGQVAVIDLMRHELVRLIDGVGPHPSKLAMVTDASYCH